ncbi:hypothetical protein [Thiocapsa marina]|uniref:Secreted protein n=1 Tax=Thiocapsa marina 5811 TaxID=768671 RepID=F9UG51_9GAMM|nr:hypothetical protein [Thiocapsa marina]EGV16777.1 hypothetical protein ThimaDRAFT_3904 [Thiocapsa marina 5811]
MFRVFRSRFHGVLAAGFFLLLETGAAPGAAAMSGPAWDACRDRVIANLEAAGLRDFGDVSAYTGATGTGALQAVIERCGYRSEHLDPAFCDDLYEQVYAACREDGFEGMSMAATSWVLIFDPQGPLVERLRRVCIEPATIDRSRFGRLICGE